MSAQDLTEDEEAEAVDEDIVEDVTAEDEDDEAEVEDDENTELVSRLDFDQTYTQFVCIYNTQLYHSSLRFCWDTMLLLNGINWNWCWGVCRRKKKKMKKKKLWLEKWKHRPTLTPPFCLSREKVSNLLRTWQQQ